MEQILERSQHRYVEKPDVDFTFALLKSTNFFYFYLHQKNDGQLEISFKETSVNSQPRPPKANEFKIQLKEPVVHSLLEGIWDNDTFYFTDILAYNGMLVNYNYKTRIFLLKKFLTNITLPNTNTKFSMTKIYYGTTLENIYKEILPTVKFNVSYILMKKNLVQNLVKIPQTKKENETTIKPKKEIKISFDKQQLAEGEFTVYKTKTTEIYVLDHGKFYSVLRVPDTKTALYLYNHFHLQNQKTLCLNCHYNPMFHKYEYQHTS